MKSDPRDQSHFEFRWLDADSLKLLECLDRSETVRTGYKVVNGELVAYPVDWNVPAFLKGELGEHSVHAQIDFCRDHLHRGGIMIGAFLNHVLIGIGVLTPDLRPRMAQLAYLQVSSAYRRKGIGTRIVEELERKAIELGAESICVSATPSESAVNFYQSRGYELEESPVEELVYLEPEDIHLSKEIGT